MTPPPTPFHILRNHTSPLAVTAFNSSNTFLYAGDQDGYISITDLKTRRIISIWKAHQGGVLSLMEWQGKLISHGRDNLILFHSKTPTHGSLSSGPGPSRPHPSVESSLTTNALNFCRFSFCSIDPKSSSPSQAGSSSAPIGCTQNEGKERETEALLAVPNLVDSELVDIYLLPSKKRLHASINFLPKAQKSLSNGQSSSGGVDTNVKVEAGRTGLAMGIHLAFDELGRLSCVMGYEDGRIELWRCGEDQNGVKAHNEGHEQGEKGQEAEIGERMKESWRTTWDARMSTGPPLWKKIQDWKGHNEAVMAMCVDRKIHRAFSVSADHLVVRYDLRPYTTTPSISSSSLISPTPSSSSSGPLISADGNGIKTFSTGQIGNASIAISPSGSVLAVGGWDGKIRLFSATSLKQLGVLSYHREIVHTLSFASPRSNKIQPEVDTASTLDIGGEEDIEADERGEDDDDDDEDQGGNIPRERWLVSGGKDKRIALWGLKDFGG